MSTEPHTPTFQTLATVRKVFAKSGVGAIVKALFLRSKKVIRSIIWVATFAYLIVPLTLIPLTNPVVPYSVAIVLSITYYLIINWGLSRHFHEQYKVYAIAGNRFSKSRVLLHYALFVEQLEETQIYTDDLRRISRWFEIAENPKKQESFLRHPLVTPILTMLGMLFAEILKTTETWKHGQGLYWIIMIAAILFITAGVFGFTRIAEDSEAKLNQFVTWYLLLKETEKNCQKRSCGGNQRSQLLTRDKCGTEGAALES